VELKAEMQKRKPFKLKIPKIKFSKKVIIIGLIVIIAVVLVAVFVINKSRPASGKVSQQTVKAEKRDLTISLSGSGPLVSSNRTELASKINGTLIKVHFKEGDNVKAGDLLFEIDDSDALLNVDKIKNSILQAQLNSENNAKALENLSVRAPFDGYVTNVNVKTGDVVGKNASLLTITDQSRLKLTVPFNWAHNGEIRNGANVVVYIQDLMQAVNGKVTYAANNSYTAATGGGVFDVEISIDNPGALKEGMKASAEIETSNGSISSVEAGLLSYINSQEVKTDSGGTVKQINIKANQSVSSGQLLIELDNDEVVLASSNSDINLEGLQQQLESANKQLSYTKIYSPIDGTITSQTVKEGDVLKLGDVVAVVANNDIMEVDVSIDELDIAKIELGQEANITVDALPETSTNPLRGKVSNIALEGTSSNGVTTYPVTVQVNGMEKLRGGMNVNVEILVSNKPGVLTVPIEAVQKMGQRNFVMVKADEKTLEAMKNRRQNNSVQTPQFPMMMANSQYGEYYSNAVPKEVEVGINNESYIEIISGLNEGDEVILPPVSTGQSNNNAAKPVMPFGGGAMAPRNEGSSQTQRYSR